MSNIDFKTKKCLNCNSTTNPNDEDELFCSKCGAPVVNRCSNYNCDELLKDNAKFCKYCGSPSIFKNYGLLDNLSSFSPNDTDDLPF